MNRNLLVNVDNMPNFYRHFKGGWYIVEDVIINCDLDYGTVYYKSCYSDESKSIIKGQKFKRDFIDFLSETDKEKYPQAEQNYRFMNIKELKEQFGEERTKLLWCELMKQLYS